MTTTEQVTKIARWIRTEAPKTSREYEAAILELLEVIKKNDALFITLLSHFSEFPGKARDTL
jgi:hypothetical protein